MPSASLTGIPTGKVEVESVDDIFISTFFRSEKQKGILIGKLGGFG